MRKSGLLVEVVLHTAGGLRVAALITDESCKTLALNEGKLVNASIKAPWVLVQGGELPPKTSRPAENCFTGIVERVREDDMGPNAVLDSITISRGYSTGGRPGTPLVTHLGLVGRVLKASAHSSIVLLLTDPSSRIAVFSQQSRAPGILAGMGTGQRLEVNFVQRDADVKPGEILITSGLDGKYPKGIPVARVLHVAPSDYTQFLAIKAEPLVDLHHLEEVLLLEPTGAPQPLDPTEAPKEFVGPPLPGPKTATPCTITSASAS